MSDLDYAGFWRRALAATLDNAVWFFGVLMILGWLPVNASQISNTAAYIGMVVVLSLWFNYFAFSEWRWGQTIGKNATRLEVRSVDGAELTYRQASIRNVLRPIDFFGIGELMIVASKRKQRLGDKAAKSVVLNRA
ncbi:MAG: RDD family protein [Solirubrobacterales bacterium]